MSWLILTSGIIIFLLGLVVLLQSPKNPINSGFGFFSFLTFLLIMFDYLFRFFPSEIMLRFTYAFAILVPATSLLWILPLCEINLSKIKKIIILIPAITFFFIALKEDLVVKEVYNLTILGYEGKLGVLFPLYILVMVLYILLLVSIIYKKLKSADPIKKKQLQFTLTGIILYAISALFFSLVLPQFFKIFGFTLLDAPSLIFFAGFTAYAILKHHLFDIKVITTEILTFSLWIFLLGKVFLSEGTKDFVINFGLLTVTVVIGIFLIRSVIKEVSQREKIEKLAEDLSKANERLKELDKQKTEFVSIASHQLRSPLTAIKGYSSMLLEGSFGPVPKKAKEAIDVIFQSSQKMISVIEDFLNITRIELGRMKYEMSDIDVGALAKQVTEEQRPQVVKNGLKLEFEDDGHDHNVYTDMGKLNQVFNNIIDNAGKYTKEGWIRVRVENLTKPEGEGVVRFVVKDSGVGIPAETLPKLFEKFVRAYDAGKVNLIGTGLGLYAAKQIVEGLGGKIWAESEGKGKGSTFIVELKHTKPLAEQEKEKKVVDFVAGI